MEAIKISVTGNTATVTNMLPITAGTVGQTVEFSFDESWEGLEKVAVFRCGSEILDRLNLQTETTVPWELMKKTGCHLWVGVYGCSSDGNVQIPTVWVDLGVILPGADPTGERTIPSTIPLWKQIYESAERIEDTLADHRGAIDQLESTAANHDRLIDHYAQEVKNLGNDLGGVRNINSEQQAEIRQLQENERLNDEEFSKFKEETAAKMGFVRLAETVLPEDTTEIMWTQGENGEKLSNYKDFFIYWVGKFDSATNGEVWTCRANGGVMYYCYHNINKPTTRCGFWWHIEEINSDDSYTIWKTTFPTVMVKHFTNDFAYENQGLADAAQTLKGDLTCLPSTNKIEHLRFGSQSVGAKMVAGSKAVLFGRAR